MKLILIAILLVTKTFLFSQVTADEIIGNWRSIERNVIVQCFKINQKYYGKVLWYKPFDAKTENRPIAKDENTKYLEKVVMKDFQFANTEWNSGKIIDITTNKTYTSFVKINEKNQLKVTGFVLFRWLSQSLIFEKLPENFKIMSQNI